MTRAVETYEQAIEYLYGRINYERISGSNFSTRDFKLERMALLLSRLGNPQDRLPAVHIAGTKGKGSTAVMVAEILQAANYRVGLFTSPHLEKFEERMKVCGCSPSTLELVELVNAVAEPVADMDRLPQRMSPTYFEIATALSWLYFEQHRAELVVLEVGLGGRLDSTNLCSPEVTAITSISRDHTHLLGSSLAEISREKAGIVKRGIPVVSGVAGDEARSVLKEICQQHDAPLIELDRDIHYSTRDQISKKTNQKNESSSIIQPRTPASTFDIRTSQRVWSKVSAPLIGDHQIRNTALAVGIVDVLNNRGWRVPDDAVHAGLRHVRCPLRIEVLGEQPTVIVDAAHNWASASVLMKTLECNFKARRRVLVFGATKDKDVAGLLRQIVPKFDTIILTQYLNNPRAVQPDKLHHILRSISNTPVHLAEDPSSAWQLAGRLATADDLICVTGSFFLAAEIRELIVDRLGSDHSASSALPMPIEASSRRS